MVYCKVISKDKDRAVYEFGPSKDKTDGLITIHSDCSYTIDKAPTDAGVCEMGIIKLLGKEYKSIQVGDFNNVLSLQIG